MDSQTLNYSIVAVGVVISYSFGFWVLSARKWFTGPVKQIEGACNPLLPYIVLGSDHFSSLAEVGIDEKETA